MINQFNFQKGNRLYKLKVYREKAILGGVLIGLSYALKLPVLLLRVIFLIALFAPDSNWALYLYFIAWFLYPKIYISESAYNSRFKKKIYNPYLKKEGTITDLKIKEINKKDIEKEI